MKTTLLKLLEEAAARGLAFLVVGGHAVTLSGFARNTVDIDLLVPEHLRKPWCDALADMGFRCFHMTQAFAQFTAGRQWVPVDLMFVSESTWGKLVADPVVVDLDGHKVELPRPEHLVALKLHAAASPTRGKPESDWEDIRQIVLRHGLDINSPGFREIVLRYGGETALERISSFQS